jgi:predicted ATP-dependent serine protease
MKNCWNCGQLFTGFLQECPTCRQIKAINAVQSATEQAEKKARQDSLFSTKTSTYKPKELTDDERYDADGYLTLDGLHEMLGYDPITKRYRK